MKKFLVLVLALIIAFSVGACASAPKPTPEPQADLAEFYQTLLDEELMPEATELTSGLMDGYYEGLSEIELEQCLIYVPTFNISATEIALIEVKNSEDVDAVVTILENRLANLENVWKNYLPAQYKLVQDAKIVRYADFVMLVIAEEAEKIETRFNELFAE